MKISNSIRPTYLTLISAYFGSCLQASQIRYVLLQMNFLKQNELWARVLDKVITRALNDRVANVFNSAMQVLMCSNPSLFFTI